MSEANRQRARILMEQANHILGTTFCAPGSIISLELVYDHGRQESPAILFGRFMADDGVATGFFLATAFATPHATAAAAVTQFQIARVPAIHDLVSGEDSVLDDPYEGDEAEDAVEDDAAPPGATLQ